MSVSPQEQTTTADTITCQSENEGIMSDHKKFRLGIRTPFTIQGVKTVQNLTKRASAFGRGVNLWGRSCSFCNTHCGKPIIMFQLFKKKLIQIYWRSGDMQACPASTSQPLAQQDSTENKDPGALGGHRILLCCLV